MRSQMKGITAQEVAVMLKQLNDAKQVYEHTTNHHTHHVADRTFADCYDWFIQRNLAIEYDPHLHQWVFMGCYCETSVGGRKDAHERASCVQTAKGDTA